MQTLVIAMQMVSAELDTSTPGKAGELYFETPGTGFGFPPPPSMRDLLTDEDARSVRGGDGFESRFIRLGGAALNRILRMRRDQPS